MQKPNRRRFLRLVGLTLGACALTCAGSGLLLSGEDRTRTSMLIGFPEESFGNDRLPIKILVAYASANGSTGGVAAAVGKGLAFNGSGPSTAIVDARLVSSVTSLDGYDAVVVGSPIHGGRWLPEATAFVRANQEGLRRVPTAFFLVGMMVASRSATNRELVAGYLDEERALVSPIAEGRFVGALFPKQHPFPTGFGMRFFLAYCGLGLRGGDYRDPVAIYNWAWKIRPLLSKSTGG